MQALWRVVRTCQSITDRGDCNLAPTWCSSLIARKFSLAHFSCVPATLNVCYPRCCQDWMPACLHPRRLGRPPCVCPANPCSSFRALPSVCLPQAFPPSPGMVICPGLGLPIYSRCAPLPNHILTLHSDRVCKCLCFLLHRARAACIVRSHGAQLETKARESQAPRGR